MTRSGTLTTIDGRPVLRFERRYRHPIERVWRAVTEPDEMAAWFPSAVVGDREVGAELVFDDEDQRAAAIEAGEPTRADGPLFRGRVVVHDPPNVFSFTWGGELLRFELTPDGEGTRLVFTQVLGDRSVAARNGAGWHACLAELDARLGGDLDDVEGGVGESGAGEDAWRAVYVDYLTRMGPAPGAAGADGSMTWQRATHVDADRVRAVVTDPAEMAAWGAGDRAGEPIRWEVEPAPDGSRYRLVHGTAGADPALAAAWHALLVQLDMYLAAGQLVPVDADLWSETYAGAG